MKSRKLEKRAVRALEAEIDALNCRKHVKEQIVAKRDNETGEEKANVEKMTKSLKWLKGPMKLLFKI